MWHYEPHENYEHLVDHSTSIPMLTASTTQLIVSLVGIVLAYGIYKISTLIYDELTSPLHYVPGPPNPSLIHGNMKQLSESVSHKGLYHLSVIDWIEWTEQFRVVIWRLDQAIWNNNSIQRDVRSKKSFPVSKWLASFCCQRYLVFWPPISKQPATYFSTAMTIPNQRTSIILIVNFSEMVRFLV